MSFKPQITEDEVTKDPIGIAKKMKEELLALEKIPEWHKKDMGDKIVEFNILGYSSFIIKHQIVARYLIDGQYKTRAFKKYLERLESRPPSGQEEWAELQAFYAKWLFKVFNPHAPDAEARNIFEKTKENLLKELNGFKEDFKSSKAEVEDHDRKIAEELKKDLLLLAKNPATREQLRKIRLESLKS